MHKGEIHAVAWVLAKGEGNITELLDTLLNFWKRVSQPVKVNANASLLQELGLNLANTFSYLKIIAGLSQPIWLTEFCPVAKKSLYPAKLEIASAPPATVSVEAIKSTKQKAAKMRQPKPVARFEDDFSIAVISKKDGTEDFLTIENELRSLIKKIIAAGGKQPRTKLRSDKLDTYQPEKLLKSKVAKSLIKTGLLGTSKSGRTTVFWAKQHAG